LVCRILKVLCSNLTLSGDFDFRALAKATPGYVGADLASLAGAAGVIAVKRMFKEMGRRELIAAAAARENGNLSQVGAGEVPSGDGPNEGDVSMKEGDGSMIVDGIENGVLIPTQSGTGDDNSKTSDGIPRPTAADAFSLPSPSSTLFCSLPRSILRTPIGTFLTSHPQALASPILSTLSLVPSDFSTALLTLQPSSKREGFATVPDVTWSDIGALHSTRDELHMAVVQPIRRPELFRKVGITAPGGVLLWGPPGCGKTLLAKAVANESRANFISIKGPELLNKVRTASLPVLSYFSLLPLHDKPDGSL
jgi:ribosome biogenesis ATPase